MSPRRRTLEACDRRGEARDRRSEENEQAAEARDHRADARDNRAEARDRRSGHAPDAAAASDRAEALLDRRGAATDRAHAAADRRASSSDRVISAEDRAVSSIDGLTRAHRRDAGIVELERDVARARRTRQSFAVAFVDVDALKATNDSEGHAAGDKLLRRVVDTIRANLRSYDLVVRYGGDEFVCGLLDLHAADAAQRFERVNADLAKYEASVTVGFAELADNEPLADLVMRADDALYRKRQVTRG